MPEVAQDTRRNHIARLRHLIVDPRITGAILRVTVPAMIIRSDWRGRARTRRAPNRSRSVTDDNTGDHLDRARSKAEGIARGPTCAPSSLTASRFVVGLLARIVRSKKLMISPSEWCIANA